MQNFRCLVQKLQLHRSIRKKLLLVKISNLVQENLLMLNLIHDHPQILFQRVVSITKLLVIML
ncbi:MAG: hypothetical protein CMK81_15755 [Pseudomonadales bacterium]|nr:hypothetical protein [Pseudomonadales bacterium]